MSKRSGTKQPDNTIYDLVPLADELAGLGAHPKVVRAIERAATVSSGHQDLAQAVDALELLMRLTRCGEREGSLEEPDLGTMAASLTTAAIVFYTRATGIDPIDRGTWFSEKRLAADLRKTHRQVMTMRNKEVAHFGKGRELDGEVATVETLVLRPFDREHPIGFLSSRAQNKARFTREFAALARAARDRAEEMASDTFTQLSNALKAALAEDPGFVERVRRHPLTEPRLLGADRKSGGRWIAGVHARRYSISETRPVHDPDD